MSRPLCSPPPIAYTVRPKRVACSTHTAIATTTTAMMTLGVIERLPPSGMRVTASCTNVSSVIEIELWLMT